jgi:hypothetical protein
VKSLEKTTKIKPDMANTYLHHKNIYVTQFNVHKIKNRTNIPITNRENKHNNTPQKNKNKKNSEKILSRNECALYIYGFGGGYLSSQGHRISRAP